ncbi:MAG: VPS10 domain-containing protein [Putridiphycobacter sp.]
MKKATILILAVLAIATFSFFKLNNTQIKNDLASEPVQQIKAEDVKQPYPNDKWYYQRAYPNGFSKALYLKKMDEIKLQSAETAQTKAVDLTLPWTQEGPGNIGGRFNILTQHPSDPNTIYAGAANGGIFKTTDGGTNWQPIFDDLSYLAIGDITFDPNNTNTLYVGTGDKNFGGHSHIGNGVYKSTDGGTTWNNSGLTETGIVTEVIVDPSNSNTVYAATLGNTFAKSNDRGVYKSTDGGATWNNILFISDSSGVIDMMMDPSDPNVLYASGYNRLNTFQSHRVYGPAAKIFKTTDGGNNWTTLGGGLPTTDESRVGLAMDLNQPDTIFAIYVSSSNLDIKDVYKSTDAGINWTAMNIHSAGVPTDMMGNFGWYFGEVYINPYDVDNIILAGVDMYQTLDGGNTWSQNVPNWWTYEVHADKHDVLFLDATSYIIATDGGLYKTTNSGTTWSDIENIPVTQFYHIAVDPNNFGTYGGGAQDNGTSYGNATNLNNWTKLYGGDGFRLTYLQNGPGMYYETQNGNIIYDDGFGSTTNVSPNVNSPDRTDWDTPYFINENTDELFVGSSVMKVMPNAPFGSYSTISGDLTKVGIGQPNGQDRYHTIVEIEGVNGNDDMLFVGTNDGLVWRGDRNGFGWDWTDVTGNLPNRYVTELHSSENPNDNIYVSFSGYTENDYSSYLFMSDDFGDTWTDISGNLPNVPVNDILAVKGQFDDYLFAALDGGVYFTSDAGQNWDFVGVDLPFVTISDIEIDYVNQKLIAGTYSRSMYSYDISWIDNLGVDFTNVQTYDLTESLAIYPNPIIDNAQLNNTEKGIFRLYNVNGKLIKTATINPNASIDFSDLSAGIYLYEFNQKKGKLVKR